MISKSAEVSATAVVPESAKVWAYAQVREGAVIGENVIIGRGAYIGIEVAVGANSKIQNYAQIFEPAILDEGVFIGPSVILTNDRFPRAVNPGGEQKSAGQWRPVGVTVGAGASIGAGSVCVAPVHIGSWAMVAAGSVVTANVSDHALVAGVPARHIGWVSKSGVKLVPLDAQSELLVCPETGDRFHVVDGALIEVSS